MKLLVYSDLHLDHLSFNPVLPSGRRVDAEADIVILAGDIDEGVRGFRWARECFPDKLMIYVLGNHEYYGQNWVRLLDEAREAANKFDIDFLECNGLDAGGIRFLGCSLWTDFRLYGDDRFSALKRAKASMNDYKEISITRTPELYWLQGRRLIPELTASRHAASVEWLDSKLNDGHDPKKTVVITHHAPLERSIPDRYQGDLLSAAYASDLSHLMGKAGTWIHGHVHDSFDYIEGGTRVICNPRGYTHQNGGFENPHFKPDGLWEV